MITPIFTTPLFCACGYESSEVPVRVFSSWIFLHRYFLTILIMITEQLYWKKILCDCFCSLWLQLLIAIMKKRAERCALQLYRTSLIWRLISVGYCIWSVVHWINNLNITCHFSRNFHKHSRPKIRSNTADWWRIVLRFQSSSLNDRKQFLWTAFWDIEINLCELCASHCIKGVRIRSYSGPDFSRIFPHSDWIRRDTEYLSVFSPNAGKCWKNADQSNSEYELF